MSTSPGLQPHPKDVEVLKLDILREFWNDYELEDGTLLRGRLILTKAMRPKHGPIGPIGFGMQAFFDVTAPPDRRGDRGQLPPQDQWEGLPKEPVEIVHADEPWNVYRIVQLDALIQVKLVVSSVFHVKGIYDGEGMPFYIVTHGPLLMGGPKGAVLVGPKGKDKRDQTDTK